MIFSENRYPLFGIMLYDAGEAPGSRGDAGAPGAGGGADDVVGFHSKVTLRSPLSGASAGGDLPSARSTTRGLSCRAPTARC